jgi:hypothetical protein
MTTTRLTQPADITDPLALLGLYLLDATPVRSGNPDRAQYRFAPPAIDADSYELAYARDGYLTGLLRGVEAITGLQGVDASNAAIDAYESATGRGA